MCVSRVMLQRKSLGWDGHSLKTFAECFSGAVAGVTQLPQSQPCPAEGDDAPAVVAADEHQQRPPEFSNTGEEGGGGENDEAVVHGGEKQEQPGAAATGTLDLHYAGAGIVGSWEIRRVQGGVSAALVDR